MEVGWKTEAALSHMHIIFIKIKQKSSQGNDENTKQQRCTNLKCHLHKFPRILVWNVLSIFYLTTRRLSHSTIQTYKLHPINQYLPILKSNEGNQNQVSLWLHLILKIIYSISAWSNRTFIRFPLLKEKPKRWSSTNDHFMHFIDSLYF